MELGQYAEMARKGGRTMAAVAAFAGLVLASQVGELRLGWLSELAFSPDGRFLAVATGGGAKLYGVQDLKLVHTLELRGNVYSLALSRDGKRLAAGASHAIWIWDLHSQAPPPILEGEFGNVFALSFSPDGALLASGSLDHTAMLWDPEKGELICTLEGHSDSVESVCFSPDGALLATGANDGEILIWDVHALLNDAR